MNVFEDISGLFQDEGLPACFRQFHHAEDIAVSGDLPDKCAGHFFPSAKDEKCISAFSPDKERVLSLYSAPYISSTESVLIACLNFLISILWRLRDK